jgi:UDP-GlcNAc:undecaprenyl-phosphate GlcNAc-1-phosphate transferase
VIRSSIEPAAQPLLLLAAAPDWLDVLLRYKTFAALFVVAAVASAVATPLYILLAARLGWVDRPAGRKQHAQATPTMGGLVPFAVVFAGALAAMSFNNRVGQMLAEKRLSIYGLLACTACMIALGIIDDRHAIRPRVKLLVQTIVAIAAVAIGFRAEAVTVPGVGSLHLPAAVSAIVSILWIVGITNAVNLTDGLDGLAAGVCFLAAAVNGFVAIWLENYYMSVMMLLLAGALLGFIRWNFHPARVFLGDTGALALGMYMALASLHAAQKAHTVVLILIPLFAMGYPIFDTLLAVTRRMVRGQPLFASDRDHIHHRLLDRTRSPSTAAVQIYAASAVLALLALAAMTTNFLIVGLAVAAVLALAVFGARVLGYLEWGGWLAHWTGRDETRLLHVAAQLARLRIKAAKSTDDVLAALALVAPETGLREIRLALPSAQVLVRTINAADAAAEQARLEVAAHDAVITFVVTRSQPLDAERRQILDELGHAAAQRLAELRMAFTDEPPADTPTPAHS